jgi:hypothetical protein
MSLEATRRHLTAAMVWMLALPLRAKRKNNRGKFFLFGAARHRDHGAE